MDKKKIIDLLNKFLEKVRDIDLQKVILFGSQATGQATEESDIDLIIVSRDFEKMNFFKRASTMRKIWNLNYPVDFLCFTPDEFEYKKNRISIVSEALKEGIIIK